jgi:hypothetical protein
MKQETTRPCPGRRGERGAALVTALLISLLMLGAGGALIYTTAKSTVNAVDSTAEVQAYYAAEAGLHSALSVLRGNVAKQAGLILPADQKMRNNTRLANQLTTANLPGDASPQSRLSGWLPYANGRVSLGDNLAFELSISDPDDPLRLLLTADPDYMPRSLLIASTGYGPKGAVKRMQLLYRRSSFEFEPPSTVLMAGNLNRFAVGSSRAKGYSGADAADAGAALLPAFGFTTGGSKGYADDEGFNCDKERCEKAREGTTDPETAMIPQNTLPVWLRRPEEAALLLNDLQAQAMQDHRYFATKDGEPAPGSIGTPADPKFTFVDGDFSVSGTGAGLLVVTGNLEFKGGFNFDGIIFVLGSYRNAGGELVGGQLNRNGGGEGTIAGSIVVAKFDRANPTAFLETWFDTDGGGNSDILYDSIKVSEAIKVLGGRVAGVVEN